MGTKVLTAASRRGLETAARSAANSTTEPLRLQTNPGHDYSKNSHHLRRRRMFDVLRTVYHLYLPAVVAQNNICPLDTVS